MPSRATGGRWRGLVYWGCPGRLAEVNFGGNEIAWGVRHSLQLLQWTPLDSAASSSDEAPSPLQVKDTFVRLIGQAPRAGQRNYTKRSARHAGALWRDAKISLWNEAMASLWWRSAGHLGCLSAKPDNRWRASVAPWRGASWRKTLHAVLLQRRDPTRRRLSRGHCCLGRRCWDDPTQRHMDTTNGEEVPWHEAANDRSAWSALEAGFVARVLRRATSAMMPDKVASNDCRRTGFFLACQQRVQFAMSHAAAHRADLAGYKQKVDERSMSAKGALQIRVAKTLRTWAGSTKLMRWA